MEGGAEGGDWGLVLGVSDGLQVVEDGRVRRTASGCFFRISRPASLSSETVNSWFPPMRPAKGSSETGA